MLHQRPKYWISPSGGTCKIEKGMQVFTGFRGQKEAEAQVNKLGLKY